MNVGRLREVIADAQPPPFPTAFVQAEVGGLGRAATLLLCVVWAAVGCGAATVVAVVMQDRD